ncbi:hypothetical protein ABPG72_000702 [Tetrahymena utriculariae]
MGTKKVEVQKRNKNDEIQNKNKKGMLDLFFETVLEIIEDKYIFSIHTNFFCFLSLIYMIQILGYVFQTNTLESQNEQKMKTLGLIAEQSTGTYFLYLDGQETMIIWTFFIAQFLMYAYIIYLILITLAKYFKLKSWLLETRKIRNSINKRLTIYFLMYIWLLSIPNLEINSGVSSCNEFGYLQQYNGSNCYKKPVIYTLYQYSMYMTPSPVLLKSNYIMYTLWFFFFNLVNQIFSGDAYYDHLDFYLEQLYLLGQTSSTNEQDKFYLFQQLTYHQNHCKDLECYCKVTTFKDEKDNLIKDDLFKLIDSIFIWSLKHPTTQKNISNMEHISLKYITYLTKYRNNSFQAYYNLKSILAKQQNLSLYFKTLSNILSSKIEEEIQHYQQNNLKKKSNETQFIIQVNQIQLVIEADKIERKFMPLLIELAQKKFEFYYILKEQNVSLQNFLDLILLTSSKALKIQRVYTQLFIKNQDYPFFKKSYRVSKLRQVYRVIVLNDLFASIQDEIYLNEILTNDQNKYFGQVSNVAVLRGDVISMKISFAKKQGEIISNNLSKIANYFGYTDQDVFKIKNIKSLIPSFISDIHDFFMQSSMQRGFSYLFGQNMQVFAADSQCFLIPINLFFSFSFENQNDCCIYSTLLKRDTTNSYILFDHFGKILGVSHKAFNQLFKSKIVKEDNDKLINFQRDKQEQQFFSQKNQIEEYFKDILPSQVYNNFSIFLIIPQILRVIRKHYQVNEQTSQITSNNNLSSNKACINLCQSKIYKIKIPYNFQDLNTKLNQFLSNFTSSKDRDQFQSGIDFVSYYKQISQFQKKNANFYENSKNLFRELDISFNLQLTTYFYEQNNVQKTRSFYCLELIYTFQNTNQEKFNPFLRMNPLQEDQENITTIENTIESSHFSQKFQTKISQDQKENIEIKDQLFLDKKNQIEFIDLTNTQNFIKDNHTHSSEQQKIQQQEEDVEFIDRLYPSNLNQFELIQKFYKLENNVQNLNIQTSDPSLFASPCFQAQTDNQIQSVPLQQTSTSAQISEKQNADSKFSQNYSIYKQYTFEQQQNNLPENTIFNMIQKNAQNQIESDPKKLKMNGFPVKQKSSTDNEDLVRISSNVRNIEQQKDIIKQDQIMHTSKVNTSKYNQDKTIYHEISFQSQQDDFFNKEIKFNQTVSTSRVLIEQNISDNSPQNRKMKRQSDEIQDNQQSEHKLENEIQDLNEQNINKFLKSENQVFQLLQNLQTKNSSQHSLSSLLLKTKGRLINQIQDKSKSHITVKIFNIISLLIVIAFISLIVIYSVVINTKFNIATDTFSVSNSISEINQQYFRALLSSLQLYQVDNGLFFNNKQIMSKQNQLNQQLNSSIYSFKESYISFMSNYISYDLFQQTNFEVIIFNNKKGYSQILRNNFEYDMLNFQNIINLKSQQNQIDGLFYLLQNMKYQEKILMTIARVQVFECESNSDIYKKFVQILKDPSSSWLQTDFVSNNFFIQITNENKQTRHSSQKSPKKLKQLEKKQSIINFENSLAEYTKRSKKLKRSQMISTSFTHQKLTKWKKIFVVSFICLISIGFFTVSNLIIKNFNDLFNQPSLIFYQSSLAVQNFLQMKTFSQILSNYRYIIQFQTTFPVVKLDLILYLFKQQNYQVQQFIPYFLNNFSKLSKYSESQTNYLANIFKQNLCEQLGNNQKLSLDCSQFSESQIQLFQGGALGIVNRYIYIFNQYSSLFKNDLELNRHLIQLQLYLNSTDYFDLFIDRSQQIDAILDNFLNTISKICLDFTSLLSQKILLYFVILGPIIFLIQIITIFYTKGVFFNQLRSLTFGLTLIPYSKMQEESTLQIIKQLLQQ